MFEQHFVNTGHGVFGYVAYRGVSNAIYCKDCISSGSWEFAFFFLNGLNLIYCELMLVWILIYWISF